MIPLSSLVQTVATRRGPDSLDRFNNLPAVKIFGAGRAGRISSGQAIARVEQIANEVLPADFSFDWGGASYQEKRSGGASTFALGLAVIMVFLILAAQYERWSLPLSVLLALPVRHVRRAGGGVAARLHQRRLFPDRPGDAARPRREERDPDRRIRRAQERRRAVHVGRGARGGAAAVPVRS